MTIPPISSGSSSQLPSENPIVDKIEKRLQSYLSLMKEYMEGDHSEETIKKLQDAAKKLVQFLNSHQKEIEQGCKANGWPAGTGGFGYDDCIEGANACLQTIDEGGDIPTASLYMLDENTVSLKLMLTQHRGG
ncbi:MAG: hypothetical protein FJZ64_02725 [Chlamydiae bacterium]|nr:hypothetical protein [Chlamydiota bacterium]